MEIIVEVIFCKKNRKANTATSKRLTSTCAVAQADVSYSVLLNVTCAYRYNANTLYRNI